MRTPKKGQPLHPIHKRQNLPQESTKYQDTTLVVPMTGRQMKGLQPLRKNRAKNHPRCPLSSSSTAASASSTLQPTPSNPSASPRNPLHRSRRRKKSSTSTETKTSPSS